MPEARTKFDGPVVLFDGYCNFCNFWVNFLIKIDRRKVLRFASAQSEAGKRLLAEGSFNEIDADSVIVYDDGKFYSKSAASLQIIRRLKGIWRIGYALVIVPRRLRDLIYDFIARNRYRWFGRRESCRVATEGDRERFFE